MNERQFFLLPSCFLFNRSSDDCEKKINLVKLSHSTHASTKCNMRKFYQGRNGMKTFKNRLKIFEIHEKNRKKNKF